MMSPSFVFDLFRGSNSHVQRDYSTGPEPMAAMRAEYLRLRDAQQAGGTILS